MSARERSTANGLGSNWVDATPHPWPPSRTCYSEGFHPTLFAHQFQILSIHRCCSRESKLCKTQLPNLVRIWLIRRLQRSEQYLPFIASVQNQKMQETRLGPNNVG